MKRREMFRSVLDLIFGYKVSKAGASTPEDIRIYVIGDIHGRFDLLEQLQVKIQADANTAGHLKIIQIFLGDYVDRGPASKAVVDFMLRSPPAGWERVCLKGNHETMVLKFLDDEIFLQKWSRSGGLETLHSYGVGLIEKMRDGDASKIQKKLKKKITKAHRKFFSTLKSSAEFGDYFFAHAGVRPGVRLNAQTEDDLLWIRKEFISSNKDYGKIIVHGHTPVKQPEILPNRINIDTGAWSSGQLTCLVLEGETRRFL